MTIGENIVRNIVPAFFTIMFLGLTASSILLSSVVYVIQEPPSYNINGQTLYVTGSNASLSLNLGVVLFAAAIVCIAIALIAIFKRNK